MRTNRVMNMAATAALLAAASGPSAVAVGAEATTAFYGDIPQMLAMPMSMRFGGKGTKAYQRAARKARNRRRSR